MISDMDQETMTNMSPVVMAKEDEPPKSGSRQERRQRNLAKVKKAAIVSNPATAMMEV